MWTCFGTHILLVAKSCRCLLGVDSWTTIKEEAAINRSSVDAMKSPLLGPLHQRHLPSRTNIKETVLWFGFLFGISCDSLTSTVHLGFIVLLSHCRVGVSFLCHVDTSWPDCPATGYSLKGIQLSVLGLSLIALFEPDQQQGRHWQPSELIEPSLENS